MNKPIVFVGPTISTVDAASLLDADYRPPAALGDVWRAARDSPPAIGIIDGYFHSVPAVWHKELLFALDRGIRLFGAASMGALRAAELAPFGMIGVGAVFNAYASGELEDDDEVAVAHADASTSYRQTSDAMVNIRATLQLATRRSVVSQTSREGLESIAKSLFYPDRTWPALIRLGCDANLPREELDRLAAWLPANRVDRKRLDALEMLRWMRDSLAAAPERKGASFHFEHTVLWQSLLNQECARDDAAVLEELKLEPSLFSEYGGLIAAWDAKHLRQAPDYERLLRRAACKEKLLAALGDDSLEQITRDDLLRWLFEVRLGGWPEDLHAFLRERGWVDEDTVAEVARQEYLWSCFAPAKRENSPND